MPKSIWALGFVSMFMDISSEMIHALLPVFLMTVLGTSATTVGLIEGMGEATASLTKVFSGWFSDRFGNRKQLAILGYGLGALSKPFFAIAPTASFILGARFFDRVGKGVRGAPRDALVTEIAGPEIRGAAFGLRQSLDTIGAFVGPLIALALMAIYPNAFRLVFSLAIIPGFIAVAILATFVHEPEGSSKGSTKGNLIKWSQLRSLGTPFWIVVMVGGIITLARFSEAFLVLRANGTGLPVALTPLVLIVMNIVYGASAYPMGILSDRLDRKHLLLVGFGVLVVADVVLASSHGLLVTGLGVVLWGLHMGMTQGILSALVADTAPASLKGTAFGFFNLFSGLALLVASVLAGWLWQHFGPSATFLAGSGLTILGILASIALLSSKRPHTPSLA